MNTDCGLIPSATLNAALMSPDLVSSEVWGTDPTSLSPRSVQAWKRPWRYPFTLGVDDGSVRRDRDTGADLKNPPILDQHRSVLDPRPGDRIHRAALNGDGLGIEPVGGERDEAQRK
jgi:hypothetical protein